MRTFSRGRLARAVAHGLMVSFVCSITLFGWGAPQASAQVVTSAATSGSVAVVPLDNLTRVRPEVFGDEAGRALSVELRDRLLLDVLPEMDVSLQMRDLGLNVPLSTAEMVRLASELEVDLLITGEIREAKLVQTPDGPAGEVVLAVRLSDRVTQADVNGALVRVRGPADPEASEDVLMKKALEQAAFQAVQEMKGRPSITATVLWTRDETVFINKNAGDGITVGMRLVAVRSGARIGVVQVTVIDSTGSWADVVEGASLRTGDYLRATYQLPGVGRPGVVEQVTKQGKRYEKVLLAAAALIGLGGFAHSARMVEEGGIAAPNFKTSNLANGLESGHSWFYSSASILTWTALGGAAGAQVVCLEFLRSFERVDVISADDGSTLYIDNAWPAGIMVHEFSLDTVSGAWGETRQEFIAYIPEYDNDGNLTYTWDDFLRDNVAELVTSLSVDFMHFGWVPNGPVPGTPYQYRVKPYLVRVQLDGTYSFVWDTETSQGSYLVSVASPEAMPFWTDDYYTWYDNPEVENVAGQMVATFRFYSAIGADEMILQVARDPNVTFSASGTYTEVIPGTNPSWWWGGEGITRQVVLNNVPGTGNTFWWRVGGRNRQSDVAPRPYPLSLTNDYGYVWCERLNFTATGMSAAGDVRQQRTDIMRARSAHQRVPTRDRGDRILSAK